MQNFFNSSTAKEIGNNTVEWIKKNPKKAAAIGLIAASYISKSVKNYLDKRIKRNTILEFDLTNAIIVDKPISEMDKIFDFKKQMIYYLDFVHAIEQASNDNKVIGMIMHLSQEAVQLRFTHRQEIRAAIKRFREKGKVAVCYADTFNDPIGSYHLATAFDKIYMSEVGFVLALGVHAVQPFIRNLFEKLEIDPYKFAREKYKTAGNLFTEEKFTEEHKEQLEKIIQEMYNQIIKDIAEARKLDEQVVKKHFDAGIMGAKEAKELKLIDELAYRDEVYNTHLIADVKLKDKKEANFLYLMRYLHKKGKPYDAKSPNVVALITAYGHIHQGESHDENESIGSSTLTRVIRMAANDKKVKAIILRVDSSGGDAVASDLIAREIELTKKKKPVYVSMASVAGSGGYYIAFNGSKIVANPGTITGSIGVLALKFNMRNFWKNKLGITFDDIKTNEKSTMLSSIYGFTDDENANMNKFLDEIYETFTSKVAKARGISNIKELAQGKIYTGTQAKELKLIDEVGGLYDTIELLKNDQKLKSIQLKEYPPKIGLVKLFTQKAPNNSDEQDKIGRPPKPAASVSSLISLAFSGLRALSFIGNAVSHFMSFTRTFGARFNSDGTITTTPTLYCDHQPTL